MDFSNVTNEGWIYLGASIVIAIIADYAVLKIGLDFFRPASRYVVWMARLGKLAAVIGWMLFFNGYWYPTFLGEEGMPLPSYVNITEWAVLGIMLLVAIVSFPRVSAGAQKIAPAGKREIHV